jgi:hypothetical protein
MSLRPICILALSLFIGTSAVARGGINIAGTWVGEGKAMYVDGTTATIKIDPVSISQENDFVYGTVSLTYEIGGVTTSQGGQISGHIQGNALTGILGGCAGAAPNCQGASILDGKITGNRMSGTVTDLSDGSVSAITLKRMAH